jgi:hypothetical protein
MSTKPPIDDGRSLEDLLAEIPEPMRAALRDGPKKVDQAKQKHEHGTPTSADLDEWLGKDGPS